MGPTGSRFDARGQCGKRIFPTASAGFAAGDLEAHARLTAGIVAADANSGQRGRDLSAGRSTGRTAGFYGERGDSGAGTAGRTAGKLSEHSTRPEPRGHTPRADTY
jgi:hypothetical protein